MANKNESSDPIKAASDDLSQASSTAVSEVAVSTSSPATDASAVVVPVAAAPDEPKKPVFRDKAFMSRTLILDSGRTLPVTRGQVEAVDDEALAFLTVSQDHELLE